MNNPDSKHKDYFNILPRDFSSHPLMYSEDEVKMLEGSSMHKRIFIQYQSLKAAYKSLAQKVPGFAAQNTFSDFLNAYMTVKSRYYKMMSGSHVMVPFGDIHNHGTPGNASWLFGVRDSSFSVQGLAAGEEYGQGWALYASEPIVRGEEITASYAGDDFLTDYELLLSYGFVLPEEQSEPTVLQYDLQVNTDQPMIDLKKTLIDQHKMRFTKFPGENNVSSVLYLVL